MEVCRHAIDEPCEMEDPTCEWPSPTRSALEPVSRCLTPEVAERLLKVEFDPEIEDRIELLAGRCSEGQLTDEERTEYESYVRTGNFITILQAKARKLLREPDAA